jgi:hypothetical protein
VKETVLELLKTETFSTGVVQITYRPLKENKNAAQQQV